MGIRTTRGETVALAGNTRELSLADLIFVKAQDPRNYRLTLSGPAGDGLLLIEGGRIVHAAYGELPPLDAAHVLVTEQNVDFEVEVDAEISGHTLDLGAQELLMEAMRRLDEGQLRRPRRVSIDVVASGGLREPPRPRSHEARRSPEAEALRRATGRVLFAGSDVGAREETGGWTKLIASVVGVGLLLAFMVAAFRAGWLTGKEHRDPVEMSDLRAPGDSLPMLLAGAPPAAPDPDARSLPTVLCRILVDTDGRVYEARVFQPRAGLGSFEQAAVAAVRDYRFAPARREGVPVPAWIVWPVDFIWKAAERDTSAPVPARFFNSRRDALPELVEGEPPESPLPERALRPKIRLRLLVDREGRVREAEVVEPREELELYERVAVDTVKTYRFTPGEREGVTVAAWIPWTLEFR